MYAIICEGEVVGRTEKPRYLKKGKFGDYLVEATEENAIAVAVNGKPFKLTDETNEPLLANAPKAVVREIDAGDVIFGEEAKTANNDERLTEIENVLMDLDNAGVIE